MPGSGLRLTIRTEAVVNGLPEDSILDSCVRIDRRFPCCVRETSTGVCYTAAGKGAHESTPRYSRDEALSKARERPRLVTLSDHSYSDLYRDTARLLQQTQPPANKWILLRGSAEAIKREITVTAPAPVIIAKTVSRPTRATMCFTSGLNQSADA